MYISTFFHKYNMVTEDIKFIKTTSNKLEEVQEDYPNSFIHIHDDIGDSDSDDDYLADDVLYIGKDRITDNLNIGNMDPNIATFAVGGLKESTVGELKQKTVSQIILDMVCPVVLPTHTNAVVSVSYSGDKLVEVGSMLPSINNISVGVNNGVWYDGTPYSNGAENLTLIMEPDCWGETCEEKSYNISAYCNFIEGGIPMDNHNQPHPELQYMGDYILSNIITITGVQPIYINDGSSITTYVKHLVNYNTNVSLTVTIPAEIQTPTVE